jgi:hypothetical protein
VKAEAKAPMRRAGLPLLLAVSAAALLVGSVDAAAPKPTLPKRWSGTGLYSYTYRGHGGSIRQTVSASVVLVPVRGSTATYEVASGTITSGYTAKTADGCTLTSSGSYRATKDLLTLRLRVSRLPKATFSGQEGTASGPVPLRKACPRGASQTTRSTLGVENPFFMLMRSPAGYPVNASLTRIAGSLRTAQSGAVWTLRFNFLGQR